MTVKQNYGGMVSAISCISLLFYKTFNYYALILFTLKHAKTAYSD